MAASITIAGLSSTEPTGSSIIGPITTVGTVVVGEKLAVPLASGDNTFNVPAGAVAVLVMAPTPNTATLKYRTSLNSGDGGLPINGLSQPFFHVFPGAAPTTVILNSGSAVSAPTTLLFI